MRIGFTYNLREDHPQLAAGPADVAADWDLAEPMQELREGIARVGHQVVDIGDPRALLEHDFDVDLIFNIAEMTGFRFREALAPALCELLGLPYTFSTADVMVTSLDKNVSNLLVRQAGGAVADWAIAWRSDDAQLLRALDERPGARWIVKPVAEGSSMGISRSSVCDSAAAVREQVDRAVATYGEPALVQRFLAGRELTVGVVERDGRPHALAPMEVELRGELFDFTSKEALGAEVVRNLAVDRSDPLYEPARAIAALAFEVIGCRDVARVDLRCAQGSEELSFLEINALPGLDPLSAETFAIDYDELLATIIASACRRYGWDRAGATASGSPST